MGEDRDSHPHTDHGLPLEPLLQERRQLANKVNCCRSADAIYNAGNPWLDRLRAEFDSLNPACRQKPFWPASTRPGRWKYMARDSSPTCGGAAVLVRITPMIQKGRGGKWEAPSQAVQGVDLVE